jgi:hypothetical protein
MTTVELTLEPATGLVGAWVRGVPLGERSPRAPRKVLSVRCGLVPTGQTSLISSSPQLTSDCHSVSAAERRSR